MWPTLIEIKVLKNFIKFYFGQKLEKVGKKLLKLYFSQILVNRKNMEIM